MTEQSSAHETSADAPQADDFPGSGGEPGAPQQDQAEGEPDDLPEDLRP
jgi:hypothetical protein